MSVQVSNIKGTTAENAVYVGVIGQLVYDETKKTFRAMDGATAGGFVMAREDLVMLLDGSQQMTGALKLKKGANIASAGTINLANATGNEVHITGSTGPITSFGTVAAGVVFHLIFDSTPTITYNAASMILNTGGVNYVASAGDRALAISEGGGNWNVTIFRADGTPVAGASAGQVKGQYSNLAIDALGTNNYNCVITADEVVLKNSANSYITQRGVSKTVNANGTVGAPLSIMSSRAASTWYYRWLWYNAAQGLTATLDPSSTSPTPPTGYTASDFNLLLPGACRTDPSGSTYLLQTRTRGRRTKYVVLTGSNVAVNRQMASGSVSLGPVALGAFVPPNATEWYGECGNQTSSGDLGVAPNSSYTIRSGSTPPPVWQSGGTGNFVHESFTMEVEGTNCYFYGNGGSYLNCLGWGE